MSEPKQAYQIDLIKSGYVWMEALDRHLTAHTYDEETSLKVEKLIKEKYFPVLKEFFQNFKAKTKK